METESNGSIPSLDVLAKRGTTGQISTSVYKKTTHTGRYLNYRSEPPLQQKRSVVNTLLHRDATICNDEDKQTEIAIKTSLIKMVTLNTCYVSPTNAAHPSRKKKHGA